MRGLILTLLLSFILFGGILDNRLFGDIDGDRKDEIVIWKKSFKTDIGEFYRVFIYKEDGKIIYQSPKVKDTDEPYAFGSWIFGVSLPEALIDINRDNQVELLAPAPVSDISPVYYRIFYWNGHTLALARPGVLAEVKGDKGYSHFSWFNPFPMNILLNKSVAWVSSFKETLSNNMAKV